VGVSSKRPGSGLVPVGVIDVDRSAANLVWQKVSDVGPWAERKIARSEARDGVGEGHAVENCLLLSFA
jgi:hypothetical protein